MVGAHPEPPQPLHLLQASLEFRHQFTHCWFLAEVCPSKPSPAPLPAPVRGVGGCSCRAPALSSSLHPQRLLPLTRGFCSASHTRCHTLTPRLFPSLQVLPLLEFTELQGRK